MNKNLFEKLLILRSPGIGPARYSELLRRFDGDAVAAAAALKASVAHRDAVMREMARAAELNIHYICDDDELYPAALRAGKNHPPVLTARGNLDTLRRRAVAMVGTRHATAAGMEFMANLATEFASHGIAVVSGMAIGTDTAAHRGALRAAGCAQTIAVLAGGVDYIWPIENESLYWDIVSRGVVVSEMPVGFTPVAQNFVQRNRWVAGIGEKLILGEADMQSGSMRTARFATDMGRKIYAIPSHPADSRAIGPNSLIKSGVAELCMGASDFPELENDSQSLQKKSKKDTGENSLLDKLGAIPVSESVLAEIVQKSILEIKRDLVVLELQGLVQKVDGGYIRM